jgi:putative transposase
MPGPKPPSVELTSEERGDLEGLVRRHKTGQQVADRARIVALACEAPGESGRPISQWSTTELAAEVMRRGIVDEISPRHAARLLKRGTSGRT